MRQLKAQTLFNKYNKANRHVGNENYEQHKKEYERAKFEFATYMYQLAFQGKLLVKTKTGLRNVNPEIEYLEANHENFVVEEDEALVHEMFGKRYRDLTDEERREYDSVRNKTYYEKHHKKVHNKYDTSISVKMFGKRLKDLNADETREYYRQRQQVKRDRQKEAEGCPNNICAMH